MAALGGCVPVADAPSPSVSGGPTTPAPAPAPTGVPEALAGRIVTTLPTSAPVVALTFDGGASDAGVPSILATLSQQGVRATFFVTGDFARRYPARVQAMAAAGHLVGNHSDTHPDFTTLSPAVQVDELARAGSAIAALTGTDPAPWFRFPFGASDPGGIETVNGQGYAAIGWTVDTLGWKGSSGGQSADTVVARVVAGARPGEIVLLHVGANPEDGTTLDADALPTVIARLRAVGYGLVGLDGTG
jgi:peptidoglycan/xylan/chitin deacetylase (PgdA/CDA1 family)